MQARLGFLAATILAVALAATPLRAQLTEGEFATPEEELAAVLMAPFEGLEPGLTLNAMVQWYAPLAIIPTDPPAEGEWAHYYGGNTDRATVDLVWGQVTWRLSGAGIGAAIVASFSIAERDMEGTMTITRIDPAIVDAIRIELQFQDPDAGPRLYPWAQFSSRLAINYGQIHGVIDPVGRIVVDLPATEAIFTADAVGFQTRPPLGGGTYASIMLSLGATGRTVFDEAMAAWGIAPTE